MDTAEERESQKAQLPSCKQMSWSSTEAYIAAIPRNSCASGCLIFFQHQTTYEAARTLLAPYIIRSETVLLLDIHHGESNRLKTQAREPSFCKWSKEGEMLCVGNSRGLLVFFDAQHARETSVKGVHTKRITCGEWTSHGEICLAGEDRAVTITKSDGESVNRFPCKIEPRELKVGALRDPEARKDHTLTKERTID